MSIPLTLLFTSHHSIGAGSLLTFDEPGKAKVGAPQSVYDLSQSAGLTDVVVVDEMIDGLIGAFKTSAKLGVKLCYGIKFVVVPDMAIKDDASLRSESKVVVSALNEQGKHDLIRIYSRAWTKGFYYVGRVDWALLREMWTPNLSLGLPFFSSFIARNTLTFAKIVPDLPAAPWVFREVGSGLPFAPLIDTAIDRYLQGASETVRAQVVPTKTVYYPKRRDLKHYTVMRAMDNRGTYDAPKMDHLASAEFCMESYLDLIATNPTIPTNHGLLIPV